MPKLVFLTQVRNASDTLPETIGSVLAQTCGDFEWVIADDASEDDTPGLLRRLAARDARVRPIFFETHDMKKNFNAALKSIYQRSEAVWLAILDGDDLLLPSFVETLVGLGETHGADLVLGRFEPFFAEEEPAGLAAPAPLMDAALGADIVCSLREFCENFVFTGFFPTAWQWWGKVFRLSVLRRMGLLAGEAWDIGFSADFYFGCKRLVLCDEALLRYRVRAASDSHRRLAAWDAGGQRAAQRHLHEARRGLLERAGCWAGEGRAAGHRRQALWYHDLREAYMRCLRLSDAALPESEVAAALLGVLAPDLEPGAAREETAGPGFLLRAWQGLEDAFAREGGFFGLGAEQSAFLREDMRGMFLSAVLLVGRARRAALAPAVWCGWALALCPALAAWFEGEELLLVPGGVRRQLLLGQWRMAFLALRAVPPQEEGAGLAKAFLCRALGVEEGWLAAFVLARGARLTGRKRGFLGKR
uniref:Glycosyltransferase family 2 protein n=1 Tax=termite gut metagenome TaxID=433724 RepID=S0DE82_9ZZZZ